MKVLSFLGTSDYKETTYIKHDDDVHSYKTDLFPKAVVDLYGPSEIIVFVTPLVQQDKQGHLTDLRESLGSRLRLENIPNGNSEADLWKIFQVCADAVDMNDEIILDITHAFRSIPLLIFIVAAYLRQVKQVQLKHIIYGAFEARDENTNRTPIFDLTPFVELLDWTNAVNVLQRSGDARPIAGLEVQDDIANALTSLSEALLTNRTLEAQDAAFKFNGLRFAAPQAPPFQMLIEQLKQNYQQMAVHSPRQKPETSLKAQHLQIRWYIENQHYLQAITLIREWLISWKCLQQNSGDWLSQRSRENAEEHLNGRIKHQNSQLAKGLTNLASDQIAMKLWEQCVAVRNDLAHCGMRNQPTPQRATDAIQTIKKLFQEFEEFVQQNLD